MKALLTGITGNLGYEVSLDLLKRGISVVPCTRKENIPALSFHPSTFEEIVACDLTERKEIECAVNIDYIVHCAGIVRFKSAGDKNEQMMINVTKLAAKLHVPIYYASTAFLHKPSGAVMFNNDYERDKHTAEQVLISSGVPYTIFRPSVLIGNSKDGTIRNFSGYYLIVRAFLSAVSTAIQHKRTLRFPRMLGKADVVPVDQAAECMGTIINEGRLGQTLYITNPLPPRSDWVLDETLHFFNVRQWVIEENISFEEFGRLDLTNEEQLLYRLATHFVPYWSLEYDFPVSLCTSNLVNHAYLINALTVFRDQEQSTHAHKNH